MSTTNPEAGHGATPGPVWTYSVYRAMLRKNGKNFAVITPDGREALGAGEAKEITDALNQSATLAAELTAAKAEVERLSEQVKECEEMVETADADAARHYEDMQKNSMAAVEAIRKAEGWGSGEFASVRERTWWIGATREIDSLRSDLTATKRQLAEAVGLVEKCADLFELFDVACWHENSDITPRTYKPVATLVRAFLSAHSQPPQPAIAATTQKKEKHE